MAAPLLMEDIIIRDAKIAKHNENTYLYCPYASRIYEGNTEHELKNIMTEVEAKIYYLIRANFDMCSIFNETNKWPVYIFRHGKRNAKPLCRITRIYVLWCNILQYTMDDIIYCNTAGNTIIW